MATARRDPFRSRPLPEGRAGPHERGAHGDGGDAPGPPRRRSPSPFPLPARSPAARPGFVCPGRRTTTPLLRRVASGDRRRPSSAESTRVGDGSRAGAQGRASRPPTAAARVPRRHPARGNGYVDIRQFAVGRSMIGSVVACDDDAASKRPIRSGAARAGRQSSWGDPGARGTERDRSRSAGPTPAVSATGGCRDDPSRLAPAQSRRRSSTPIVPFAPLPPARVGACRPSPRSP